VAGGGLARIRPSPRLESGQGSARHEEVLKARKLLAKVEERELRIAVKKDEYVPLTRVREE
jgi:hypothetical protein